MSTFQGIIYAVLRGFTQFLPVSWDAHQALMAFLNHHAPVPSGIPTAIQGALALGVLLSVLIFFRHDWASQISCFLQVLLFRRKPMTLDERMPVFLLIATLPVLLGGEYLRETIVRWEWTPLWIAASLSVTGLLLAFSDSFSRKIKGMSDWNWLDALVVGLLQLLTVFVGVGGFTASWLGGMFRNYNREAAAKFGFYTLAPLLTVETIREFRAIDFHSPQPSPEMSWMTFYVAIVVAMLTGLLAIGGFMKHVQRKSVIQYVVYRWILAAATIGLFFYRGQTP